MNLILKKPLAFFDLETTGINIAKDRIVEISILKIQPDNTSESFTKRINPTIPIALEASLVHGIYDNDVINCPTFKELAQQIIAFFKDCDIAGFNSNKFDIPLLIEEFLRVGLDFDIENKQLVDVMNIYHYMEPRNLSAAYKFYCNKNLDNAHSAKADVTATYEILKAQVEKYQDVEFKNNNGQVTKPIKNSVDSLATFSSKQKSVDFGGRIILNDNNVEVFNFGKYKGKTIKEVFIKDTSYYSWMMQGDFPLYTKKIITKIKLSLKNG